MESEMEESAESRSVWYLVFPSQGSPAAQPQRAFGQEQRGDSNNPEERSTLASLSQGLAERSDHHTEPKDAQGPPSLEL